MSSRAIVLIAVLLWYAPCVSGGDNPRSVTAVRTASPPRIDGVLDDAAWRLAEPAADFIQRDPHEGVSASERTEIRVLYDNRALYFGCFFFDSHPEEIVARLTRRDNEIESDAGSIRIDSFHDQQTCFEFTFNAAGVKTDILEFNDGENEDESWNVVWDVETRITPLGWCAEVRIPFSILRYQAGEGDTTEHVWGVNFLRFITRMNEDDRWAFSPKSQSGLVSRFGHLSGLRRLPVPRPLEVLPFALARQQWEPPGSVLRERQFSTANAGVDLKYGLSNSLTLDMTVNPDFGQVEADPAVLNLTTFETFYPEQRPFFLEGTQILRFSTFGGEGSGPGLFYSRRIGRGLSADEADVASGGSLEEIPQSVRILGAAKLTGRIGEKLSIGVLQAVTRREVVTVTETDGSRQQQLLEPLADYAVVRLKQDVLSGSNIGMIASSVLRQGRIPALAGGADWRLKFEDNAYQLDGFLAGSSTSRQTGEYLSGSAGRLAFGRIGARHWLWSVSGDFTSKGFNINDAGYFRRPNDFGGLATLRYKEDQPDSLYWNYQWDLMLHERRNFDGANIGRSAALSTEYLLRNYWGLEAMAELDWGLYDDRETRGNGLYRKPSRYGVAVDVGTDDRKSVILDLTQEFTWDSHQMRKSETGIGLEMRPLSWMDWECEASYERTRLEEAWVENAEIGGRTASIFADRSTDAVDLRLRGNITFARDLTLQLYAQVFLAKGHYLNFRRMVGTSAFDPYSDLTLQPDFNERSFIANVVLRWEYLPGSTLYLVWSQSREGEASDYFTSLGSDLRGAFRVPASNVVMLKVSYWWDV
jgi:hypothetical protein